MVDPAYFFSTLAQVSATIVGFVIAFSVGLYPLERQRREGRTDRLRQALINFRNEYSSAIQAMSSISHDGGVTTKAYLKDFSNDSNDLRDQVQQDDDQRGDDSPVIWAHFYRIKQLLEKVDAENDYLLTSDEIESLQNSINWLYGYFDASNSDNSQFHRELSNLPNSDIPDGYYYDDVYDSGSGAVNPEDNLKRWIRVESDGRHRSWSGYSSDDSNLSGKNLFSFGTVLEYMEQDFDGIEARRSGTILDYNPRIKYILIGAFATGLAGIIVPMLFLFSPPETATDLFTSGWLLYKVQWAILIVTIATIIYLMYHVVKQFKQVSGVRAG